MIKAIVFDLGGVVFTSDTGSYETREILAKDLKINTEKLHNFWFKRKKEMITGKMSENQYIGEMIKEFHLKISSKKIKKLIRGYNAIDKKMEDIILSLKQKYNIFALTNDVSEWIDFRINNFNLHKLFVSIISSSDIGLAKPDQKIYRYLIKELKLRPEEIIFVDNRIENTESASQLGIKIHHFKTRDNFLAWLKSEKILEDN